MGHLQDHFDHIDGFRLEADARRILAGLGFKDADLDRPLDTFSGGWQRRAAMGRLLLSAPDVLLLDEPTNHLDTDATEWLERYLRNYQGTVVVVSHDRFFLERTVTQISELDRGRLTHYVGNYSEFERLKQEAQERRRAEYERQKERIAEIERFIERFRYKASKAKQVQSRVRMLEKMDVVAAPESEKATIKIQFPKGRRAGDQVLDLVDVKKNYGSLTVFEHLNLSVERGERVALVGPNGAGKSTLSRLITQLEQPSEGRCTLGHNVDLGVYTQEVVDQLDTSRSVLDELSSVGGGHPETFLRSLLGCFLFRGDSVFKPVEVLSGGEKSRLTVAKLMLQKVNFLVLDEPTNHLDIQSKDILQQALAEFDGTVIVVSHDRYFLDRVVDRVLELRDGQLRNILGNYSAYVEFLEREKVEAAESTKKERGTQESAGAKDSSRPRSKEERKRATEEKIRRGRILREKQKVIDEIESRLAPLEKRLQEIEAELIKPEVYENPEKLKQVNIEHGGLKKQCDEAYAAWEEAQWELEQTKEELEKGDGSE